MNVAQKQQDYGETINARPFVEYLERLAGVGLASGEAQGEEGERALTNELNRAALARLRRTLGKPIDAATDAYPYVVAWTGDASGWREECYYLVAALFAFYPQRSWHHETELRSRERNFGASFLKLEQKMRNGEAGAEAANTRLKNLERRFTSLLVSRRDDLPERLRYAVSLLKANEIAIDWVQLLRDLWRWKSGEQAVSSRREHASTTQRDWAKSFWRLQSPKDFPLAHPAGRHEGDM
jgi:CRISPR type I-E-associated protein CasB/Cse2